MGRGVGIKLESELEFDMEELSQLTDSFLIDSE